MNKIVLNKLAETDPAIFDAIKAERNRQTDGIELIASENFVSQAVLQTAGSIMTNKYAEGYPHHRYYGGCENMDVVEDIARDRACKLFNAEHANVQPHSGSQANMGVYMAVMEPFDRLLGMDLTNGGHLTHGAKVSFSGKLYLSAGYGVDPKTGRIDYDEVMQIAKEFKPRLIVCGASAYPRILDFKKFREIADSVGAYLMADIAHIAGLVVAGVHPNPFPDCDFVTTTTHKTMRGPRGGVILCKEPFAKKIDKVMFPGIQGGPLMHIIAAKAVAFKEADTKSFVEYQAQVIANAKTLADTLMKRGFDLVSGGTDNHLILVDLTKTGITGKEAEEALGKAEITVNKNTVPGERRSPFIASGIRIGTPAVTTRGMKEAEMGIIGNWIADILSDPNENTIAAIHSDVKELCSKFVFYPEITAA